MKKIKADSANEEPEGTGGKKKKWTPAKIALIAGGAFLGLCVVLPCMAIAIPNLLAKKKPPETATPQALDVPKPIASAPSTSSADVEKFHEAVRKGDLETIKALLAKDKSLATTRSKKGEAVIHEAVAINWEKMPWEARRQVMVTLIENGADVNDNNNQGFGSSSALLFSISLGRVEIIQFLLENGADPNLKNIGWGLVGGKDATPMQTATSSKGDNRSEIINLLQAHGAK